MPARSAIPTDTVQIDGLNTTQAITGDGEPVVMLHGWGADLSLLWPVATRLAGKGYCVYTLDLPGFGDTDEPPNAWTVHDYAAFVLKYLDYHRMDSAYLFGHSFGGRLGLILAAEHPERVRAMTLADAAGLRKPPPLPQRIRLSVYKGIRDGLKWIGLRSLSDSLRGWYNRHYGSSDFNAASGVMRDTFVRVVNEDLRDYARRALIPTLLIWGQNDTETPLWQARTLEQIMPDAGLVVYPGCGHYSYLENPVQTVEAMHALFTGG